MIIGQVNVHNFFFSLLQCSKTVGFSTVCNSFNIKSFKSKYTNSGIGLSVWYLVRNNQTKQKCLQRNATWPWKKGQRQPLLLHYSSSKRAFWFRKFYFQNVWNSFSKFESWCATFLFWTNVNWVEVLPKRRNVRKFYSNVAGKKKNYHGFHVDLKFLHKRFNFSIWSFHLTLKSLITPFLNTDVQIADFPKRYVAAQETLLFII